MRHAIIVTLAIVVAFSAQARAAPAGWSTIVGKTCMIRNAAGSGVEAKFLQRATGPTVRLRGVATRFTKVVFRPPNGIYFDAVFNAGGYRFTYDDNRKAWSGTYAGEPSYLRCPP
jgi:hypothetical protein